MAAKVRADLEYFDQVIDGDDMVLIHDPIRGTYIKFNLLQAAMLRALDGNRTPSQITAVLSEEFEVEIPPEAAIRFIARARDLMLLEITSYEATPAAARRQVQAAMRKAGFRRRDPKRSEPARALTPESTLFAEVFRQLDLGHVRAAAGYLTEILALNPENVRAQQLHELIQTAYLRATGPTTDFPTWRLFNPLRVLTALSGSIGRFVFGWIGAVALIALLCLAGYAYTLISFDNLSLGALDITIAVIVWTIATLFHELGHGLTCQYYGGRVTEIGFMLFYYLRPAFYCDTSSSYLIQERRHKVMVQMGGTLATLVFVGVQAIVLALLNPDLVIYSGLALALIIVSAVAFLTLIPLVKSDGYFALCDYFAFPNLRERSFKLARAALSARLLGIETQTEELPPRTRKLLIAYAVCSFAFTLWFIYVAYFQILAPVVERFGGTGLVFAALLSLYLLRNLTFRPLRAFGALVIRERRQVFTRGRMVVMLVLAAVVIAPWFLRYPVRVDGELVVVPRQRADVRAQILGRVEKILVVQGQSVRRGEPLAILRNPALQAQIAMREAELAVASFARDQLRRGARAEELAVARARVTQARSEVRRQAGEVKVARALARSKLGSQSSADLARGVAATTVGAAGSAKWALSLLETGARPEELAYAEAECARIASQLAHLRAEAALLTLRAPIDGVVATAHLEDKLQSSLVAGDVFAEVHDLNSVVAEMPLSPGDPLGEIKVGDEVALRMYGAPHDALLVRIDHLREPAAESTGERRIVLVTTPFTLDPAVSGLTGHARIYGAERSLAYAQLYLPLQRLVRVRLWSMW